MARAAGSLGLGQSPLDIAFQRPASAVGADRNCRTQARPARTSGRGKPLFDNSVRLREVLRLLLNRCQNQKRLRAIRIHLHGSLCFGQGFRQISLRGVRAGDNGLSLCILRVDFEKSFGAIARFGKFAGGEEQICQIELRFRILGRELNGALQFLIGTRPITLLEIGLCEFVVCLRYTWSRIESRSGIR